MKFTFSCKSTFVLYILLTFFSISVCILAACILNINYFTSGKPSFDTDTFKMILFANIRDYFKYVFLYLLSPIMLVIDTIINSFQITIGVRILGTLAIPRLMPHSLIELPNILIYHFLSFYQFSIFLKNRSLKANFKAIRRLKWVYMASFLSVILGALVEGYIG